MTFEEFDEFQSEIIKECIRMRDSKGKEYANSENRFDNFNRLAEELGLTNIQVAWVYAAKHLDSIKQAIRTKQYTGRAEPLLGRFVDSIVYFTLIAGMIEEEISNSK
jgi:preprotein translocase subunit SecA